MILYTSLCCQNSSLYCRFGSNCKRCEYKGHQSILLVPHLSHTPDPHNPTNDEEISSEYAHHPCIQDIHCFHLHINNTIKHIGLPPSSCQMNVPTPSRREIHQFYNWLYMYHSNEYSMLCIQKVSIIKTSTKI